MKSTTGSGVYTMPSLSRILGKANLKNLSNSSRTTIWRSFTVVTFLARRLTPA